jgi:hypothetical protein
MNGTRLKERLSKLEQSQGGYVGGVWIISEPGEIEDDACARYEADHGPIGDRMAIIWMSTGVPRGPGSIAIGSVS